MTPSLFEKLEQLQHEVMKLISLLLERDLTAYAAEINSLLEQLWKHLEKFLGNLNTREWFETAEQWVVKLEIKLHEFFEKPDLEWAHRMLDAILKLIDELKQQSGLTEFLNLLIPKN